MAMTEGVDVDTPPGVNAAYATDSGGSGRDYKRDSKGTPTGGQFAKDPKSGSTKQPAKRHAPTRHAPVKKTPAGPTVTTTRGRQPILKRGAKNNAANVRQLQALMRDLKVGNLAIDGQFGPATEAAVKAVQARLGMKPTGRASAALVRRLRDAHTLSPCVKKVAAAEYDEADDDAGEDYEADVVNRVEVSPDTWVCAHEDGTVSLKVGFDAEKAREWSAAFAEMADDADDDADDEQGDDEPVTAAAGKDVTPGNDQLHHWWVYGEGKARWHTWTELRDQLVEHVGPVKAAVYASAWYHERYGIWSGSDLNRVKHGKPPRGEKVGPG